MTYFEKNNGPLTKHVTIGPSGEIDKDSTNCWMATGTMTRAPLADWRELATALPKLQSNAAIALGRMRPGLDESVFLTTRDSKDVTKPGYAARIAENIIYEAGAPAFVLIDFDTKGMTPGVKSRLDELGGYSFRRWKVSTPISGGLRGSPDGQHPQG